MFYSLKNISNSFFRSKYKKTTQEGTKFQEFFKKVLYNKCQEGPCMIGFTLALFGANLCDKAELFNLCLCSI